MFMAAVFLSKVLAGIVVLAIHWRDECDVALRTWAIGHMLRCVVQVAILRFEYKHPSLHDPQLPQDDFRCYRYIKLVMSFAYIIWFIYGNTMLFRQITCDDTAPALFRLCIAFVVLGYMEICLPLFACIVFVFCFPCVLLFLRFVNRPLPPEEVRRMVDNVPVVKFQAGMYEAEDAKCAICLDEYQPGVELRVLHCNHHLHKRCADDWFNIQQVCPLCKRGLDAAENIDSPKINQPLVEP